METAISHVHRCIREFISPVLLKIQNDGSGRNLDGRFAFHQAFLEDLPELGVNVVCCGLYAFRLKTKYANSCMQASLS